MAEFSLGSGRQGASGGGGGGEDGIIPPEGLFLYGSGSGGGGGSRSTEAITRGFEIWQQQQQQQGVRHPAVPHLHMTSAPAALLSFSSEGAGGAPLQAARGMSSSSSSRCGGMSCQDCGNQAKKDCAHLRCRTCCKSRGFECATHVRSTWVPAAKRRERQQHHLLVRSGAASAHPPAAEPSKRPREEAMLTRLSTAATSSGGEISFPAEVNSLAVFRCLRVSSVDEAEEEEFAYQAAVSIGGHVFKGILYDHGPDHSSSSATAATLGLTAGASSTSVTVASVPTSAGLLDPSALYPTPLSAFMAGTQFFPHQGHGHGHGHGHHHPPPRQ